MHPASADCPRGKSCSRSWGFPLSLDDGSKEATSLHMDVELASLIYMRLRKIVGAGSLGRLEGRGRVPEQIDQFGRLRGAGLGIDMLQVGSRGDLADAQSGCCLLHPDAWRNRQQHAQFGPCEAIELREGLTWIGRGGKRILHENRCRGS